LGQLEAICQSLNGTAPVKGAFVSTDGGGATRGAVVASLSWKKNEEEEEKRPEEASCALAK